MTSRLPVTPVLETQRLVLRPLRVEDAPAIQEGFADWQVIKHLHAGIPWPYPADGALTNVRECLGKRERDEQFFWVLAFKHDNGRAIGRIDLKPEGLRDRDMRGFWLARQHWGRGLMTEAAERVTRFAFEELRWDRLWVGNSASNAGSRRIKEKQGARLVDVTPFDFVGGPGLKQTWLLEREAWIDARRPRTEKASAGSWLREDCPVPG